MSKSYRIERDSLGEVNVPSDALYGAQTQRAFENFRISGQCFSRSFIQAMGMIKKSAALTNLELGNLSPDIAEAIAAAAEEVISGKWDEEFVVDIYQTGSGTSTNMNANEVIANRANQILGNHEDQIHPNDHVNFGQSSNDVIPSAIHISARMSIERELIPALTNLRNSLTAKAESFDHILKSGRTHLMDATPIRLGQEFSGYAHQITKGIDRIRTSSTELTELALGGTAVGTGINTHHDFGSKTIARISEYLELDFCEAENHFEAQASKDAVVNVAGTLNTIAVSFFKIANDLRWLSSGPTSGISEISMPAIQPGSSIMPGKVNPVMCEAMMMVAARVMGNHTTITTAGQLGNFELNVMMPVMAHSLLESVTIMANMATSFAEKCVDGIEANEERASQILDNNPSIATVLNPHIGYDKAAEVVKIAICENLSIREVLEKHELIPPDKLEEVLDVRKMTEPGILE